MIECVERMLRSPLPEPDDNVDLVNAIVEEMKEDRDFVRVEQVCDRFGMNVRKLQRLFGTYVGVNPKWVLQLYRLQHAAEAIESTPDYDWPGLAVELGYHDQSHFIKEFKAVVGRTPGEYA